MYWYLLEEFGYFVISWELVFWRIEAYLNGWIATTYFLFNIFHWNPRSYTCTHFSCIVFNEFSVSYLGHLE